MIRIHPDLEADMVDVKNIRPHPMNANNGDVDEIRASMQIVGCYRPVYVSALSGHIVGGHHVYEALLAEGHQRVPVKMVDCKTPEEELRVLAADNGIARRARMDPGLEIELLTALEATEFGLTGTGSDEYDLARLRAELDDPFHPGAGATITDDEDTYVASHTCTSCGEVCNG